MIAATLATAAFAAPLHAQHAGHGTPAPAPKSDTAIARTAKDAHAGHGAAATKDAHAGHGAAAAKGAHGAHGAAGSTNEHMSGWKELDAYHMVMMRVWHPAKEKGDLAPIRAQAGALAASAETLQKGAIPAACDTPANREHVAAVQRDSHALAALVGNGSDAAVLDALRALHDRFEVVNRGCKAG
jgi:hypothetical protein